MSGQFSTFVQKTDIFSILTRFCPFTYFTYTPTQAFTVFLYGGPLVLKSVNKVLYAQIINGGLSVPNLQTYYTAANVAPLSHLHETYQLPLWATIDLVDSDPF